MAEVKYDSNCRFSGQESTKDVKVVTTEASKVRKTLASKMADNVAELKNVDLKDRILADVLAPGVKGFFSDLISNVIEVVSEVALSTADILIWGEDQKKHRRKSSNTSYSSYYDKKKSKPERTSRNTLDFDDISFRSKTDAKEVLDQLRELCDEYDAVSVAEFYRSVGMDHSFTDEKYGWTNLSSAYISRSRDGNYVINMPKARALD